MDLQNLEITFINNDVQGIFKVKPNLVGYKMYGIPKRLIGEACKSLESGLQGIYFLVNTDQAKNSKRYLYVGQTKQGPNRLENHKLMKDGWNMAYMFLADKEYLNLQTVDELEALEIQHFTDCGKYDVKNIRPNKAAPSSNSQNLSESMEAVLAFFGYDLLPAEEISEETNDLDEKTFLCTRNGTNGRLIIQDKDHFILQANSRVTVAFNEENIMNKTVINLRKKGVKDGLLKKDNGNMYYLTTKDISFNSPSAAGAFVCGNSSNGKTDFKNKDGMTLGDFLKKTFGE